MSNGLKQKTLKGIGWSFADDAANQGIRFIVGLVLARLLTPHDFGIVGIALIFVSIFEDISDGGFSNALIRKKIPRQQTIAQLLLSILVLVHSYMPFYFS